jgi:hypothetical protein
MQRQLVFIIEDWAIWPFSGQALSRQIGSPHGTIFLVIKSIAQMHECSKPQNRQSGLCDYSLLSEYKRFAKNVASIFSVEELRVSPPIFIPHPHTWQSFAANHEGTVRISARHKLHFTARRWNFPVLVLMTSNTMPITTDHSDLNLPHSRASPRALSSVVS